MPLSRVKVWIAGDILTASDLNTEFNNLINNGLFQPLNVNFDVGNFQLQNMRLENFAATQSSSASKIGRIYYQTAENLIHIDTGIVTGGTGANPGPGGIARVPAIQGLQAGDLIVASNYVSAQLTPLATSYQRLGVTVASASLIIGNNLLPIWGTQRAPTVQTFASTGTYTRPTGVSAVLVMCIGGGGSGGGSSAALANGGGGGSGEKSWGIFTDAAIGATIAVTIPAAAAAIGSNTNSVGNTGGTVSFGGMTAIGGTGGTAGNNGGAGGAGGTGGSAFTWHEPGFFGADGAGAAAGVALNTQGGGSGGGAQGGAGVANSGGGGGGGTTAVASGAGAQGQVIVIEFYRVT